MGGQTTNRQMNADHSNSPSPSGSGQKYGNTTYIQSTSDVGNFVFYCNPEFCPAEMKREIQNYNRKLHRLYLLCMMHRYDQVWAIHQTVTNYSMLDREHHVKSTDGSSQ